MYSSGGHDVVTLKAVVTDSAYFEGPYTLMELTLQQEVCCGCKLGKDCNFLIITSNAL